MAFIYRFSLDRRLTDLNEEVDQKSAIVKANLGFENRFRNLQSRVEQISGLFNNQDLVLTVIHHLEEITPSGIHLTSLSFLPNSISINAVANDSANLALFLQNLKHSNLLTKININQLTKKNTGAGESLFQIEAQINEKSVSKPVTQ
jgi:Tfp pilus assembly protein PilN